MKPGDLFQIKGRTPLNGMIAMFLFSVKYSNFTIAHLLLEDCSCRGIYPFYLESLFKE